MEPTTISIVIPNELQILQGVITTDPQGNTFFIPNCSFVLSIDTQFYNGFDIITSKI